MPTPTTDRNVAIARRFIEVAIAQGDQAVFGEIVHADIVVDTGLKPTGPIRGRDDYAATLASAMGAAFSNVTLQVLEVAPFLDGRVLVRFTASADNTGALNGVAPTGKRFTFNEMHLMRFDEDGMLVENLVGGLNPLQFEVWQAPYSAPLLLG